MSTMRAAVFVEPGKIELQQRPIPDIGPTDALLRVTTTTICSTDVHILKGEYPVRPGLIVGHEPVGIIEKLGSAVTGYEIGQRVMVARVPRSRKPLQVPWFTNPFVAADCIVRRIVKELRPLVDVGGPGFAVSAPALDDPRLDQT